MELRTESHPAVSVIIPAFRCEKTIRRAIDSVLKQTWQDLELIVVCHNTQDCAEEIAHEYEAADARVRVYSLRGGRGAGVPRNEGISKAQGSKSI